METAKPIVRRIAAACRARGLQVATAESCTGGRIAHLLTAEPGASDWYPGGIVAYANAVKSAALDVPQELIVAHGAVSAEVAAAMAVGARARFHADLAVAVTGIAGPGGGTPTKPVGLIWIAVADARGAEARQIVGPGGRDANREAAAHAALLLLAERAEAA
ncbi:MAG: CinA family protein [Chloroflexota bacterium]